MLQGNFLQNPHWIYLLYFCFIFCIMAALSHAKERFCSVLIIISAFFLAIKTCFLFFALKAGKSVFQNTTGLGVFVVTAFVAILLFSTLYYASLRFKVVCEDYINNVKTRGLVVGCFNVFCLVNFTIFFIAIVNFIAKI